MPIALPQPWSPHDRYIHERYWAQWTDEQRQMWLWINGKQASPLDPLGLPTRLRNALLREDYTHPWMLAALDGRRNGPPWEGLRDIGPTSWALIRRAIREHPELDWQAPCCTARCAPQDNPQAASSP